MSKDNSLKSENAHKEKHKQARWLDISFIICMCVAFFVENLCIGLYKYNEGPHNSEFLKFFFENNYWVTLAGYIHQYSSTISTVVLPIIITILGVAITISRENIYGLSLNKFRNIDVNRKYTITGMIILAISFIGGCVLFYVTSCTLTLLTLNIFALIYSIYFIWQEVPILNGASNKLHHVVTSAFAATTSVPSSDSSNEPDESSKDKTKYKRRKDDREKASKLLENDANIAMGNLVLEEGLDRTWSLLDSSNHNLVSLNKILNYYLNALDSASKIHPYNIGEYINNAFETLDFFFEVIKTASFDDINKKECYETSGVVKLLFWLEKTLEVNKLFNDYGYRFERLLYSDLIPHTEIVYHATDEYVRYLISIINSVLIYSINTEQTWYFDQFMLIFEKIYKVAFPPMYNDYLIYLVLFIDTVSTRLSDSMKDYFTHFTSNEVWSIYIKNYLNRLFSKNGDLSRPLDLLDRLLDIVSSVDSTLDFNNDFIYPVTRPSNQDVINWWICLLVHKNMTFETTTDFINQINTSYLDNERKQSIKKCIVSDFKTEIQLNKQIQKYSSFFTKFGIKSSYTEDSQPLTYLNAFASYREENQNKIVSSEVEIDSLKKEAFDSIDNVLKRSNLYKKSLKVYAKKVPSKTYRIQFDASNVDEITNWCSNNNELVWRILTSYFVHRVEDDTKFIRFNTNRSDANKLAKDLLSGNPNGFNPIIKKNIKIGEKTYNISFYGFRAVVNRDESSFEICNQEDTDKYLDETYFKNGKYYVKETGKSYATRKELKDDIGSSLYELILVVDYIVNCNMEEVQLIDVAKKQ